ncbi:MAG: 30S ribosome-binding factor RbfA [Planctomycetes bacterium]|nr:30S ribosome-binding factor RbfA [Planctomycetota bacterium]
MMNRRVEHMTAAIERGVRQVLSRGLHDPRVQGLVTVTGVKVLPDFSKAVIDISVMPEEKQNLTFHGISDAASYIRREVGDLVEARQLPRFEFRLDTSLKKQAEILKAIERAKAEFKDDPGTQVPEGGDPS